MRSLIVLFILSEAHFVFANHMILMQISTGGIIALGLGVEGWSVETCIQKFTRLCSSAFTPREFHGIPGLQQLAALKHSSKYKTRPLLAALQQSFSDQKLFGGVNENENHQMNVAVTSTNRNCEQAIALTNYNRQNYGPDQRMCVLYRIIHS